jgi:F-type H+-transporting ATPase subunit delta
VKSSLLLPIQSLYKSTDVTQVNIAASTGDMGILANHVPSVEPLRPGVVEVIETNGQSKKWFGMLAILSTLDVRSDWP